MKRRPVPISSPPPPGQVNQAAAAAGARILHPDFNGPVRARVIEQPANDELATAQTISLMSHFAREDSRAASVRMATAAAIRGAITPRERAAAIWKWAKEGVRYVLDDRPARSLEGVNAAEAEVLIRPADLLEMPEPAGDCDDFSMLVASMLIAAGITPAYKTIAAEREAPGQYSHVYVIALCPDGPMALDASHGPYPGWEATDATPVTKWRLWGIVPPTSRLAGLEAIDWGSIIRSGVEAGTKIATARYGQPPAGTYQQGADGSILYRQQPGAGPLSYPGAQIGTPGGISTLVLIGGALLIVALVIKR